MGNAANAAWIKEILTRYKGLLAWIFNEIPCLVNF